jgi:hypothetical protein
MPFSMAEEDGAGMLFADPPSPHDTLETWQTYLNSIKELPENTIFREDEIKRAESET